MPTACDIGKNKLDNLKHDNEARNKVSNADVVKRTKQVADSERRMQKARIADKLIEKFSPDTIITEKDFDEAIIELYGKNERIMLLERIDSLYNTNEMLRDIFDDIIREHVHVQQHTGRIFRNFDKEKGLSEFNAIGTGALAPSTLKVIYRELLKFTAATNADDKRSWGWGLFEHWKLKLYTPKTAGKTIYADKNAAYFKFANEMTAFHEKISYRINEFMYRPKTWKKKRDYGMYHVLKGVEDLSWNPIYRDVENPHEILQEIFHWLMNGRVFIDERKTVVLDGQKVKNPDIGRLMIYEDRTPTGKVYKSTGDPIYAWQNPIRLEEWRDGRLDVPINKNIQSKLLKLVDLGRTVDNDLFDYFAGNPKAKKKIDKIGRHQASVKEIQNEIKLTFPKLGWPQINILLWKPESKEARYILNSTLMSEDEKIVYNKLLDAFQGYALLEPSIYNGSIAEKKENHFPAQFALEIMPYLLDNFIKQTENDIIKLEEEIKDTKGKERTQIKNELKEKKASLKRAQFISERKDNYPIDTTHNIILPIAKDNKFIKRITNAFPHEAQRVDAGVYYTYLKHIMTGIQRNRLTAKLIKGIREAKNEKVQDALFNYYKVPFNRPDTGTNFLAGSLSVTDISKKLENSWIKITPHALNRRIGTMTSYLTANYLSGIGTTVQNLTAINQNIIDHSGRKLWRAMQSFKNNKKEWEELIQESGIVEFQDFFSQAMVNDLANQELEDNVSATILGAMMQYHKEKKKLGAKVARDNFDANIEQALQESSLWAATSASKARLKIRPLKDKEQIKLRIKERKAERNRRFINKLVNFAINKEFVFNKHIKGWKIVPYRLLGATFKARAVLAQRLGTLQSIGTTESYIRSVSFIIGVQSAMDNGHIRDDIHPWENREQLDAIIDIGRMYSRFTNYGLSTTDVGQGSYGKIGNVMMKFKYWSQQKFGRDTRIIKNAIISMQDISKIDKGANLFDPKAIIKTLKLMLNPKYRGKDLWTLNPEVAALRAFMILQAPLTIFFDLFVFGPLMLPGFLGRQLAIGPTKYLRGMGSDLVSLSFTPFLIAAMAFMGDDEEEDVEQALTGKILRTYVGWGPTFAWDNMIWLVYLMLNNVDGLAKQTQRIMGILPIGETPRMLIRESIEAMD